MSGMMVTEDGWTVEVIELLNDRPCYRVKRDGLLVGPGRCHSVDELRRRMGDDAFARLQEASSE